LLGQWATEAGASAPGNDQSGTGRHGA
jgi:hypothetical protein